MKQEWKPREDSYERGIDYDEDEREDQDWED